MQKGERENTPRRGRKIGWQIPTIAVCVIVIVVTLLLRNSNNKHESTITLSREVQALLAANSATPAPAQEVTPAPNAKSTAPAEKSKDSPKKSEKKVEKKAEVKTSTTDSKLLYGIERANYQIKEGKIEKGQTLATLIKEYVGWGTINKIVEEAKPIFNLNNVKAGNRWTIFYNTYADKGTTLDYFVYEINKTEVLVVNLTGDEVSCSKIAK